MKIEAFEQRYGPIPPSDKEVIASLRKRVANLEAVITATTRDNATMATALQEAAPVLRHFENQLASSLSCDSRSHDADREPRRLLNNLLALVAGMEKKT